MLGLRVGLPRLPEQRGHVAAPALRRLKNARVHGRARRSGDTFTAVASIAGATRNRLIVTLEPFRGNLHHPEHTAPICIAMPVRAAARNESEVFYQRAQTRHVLGGMTRVSDLHPIESFSGKRFNSLPGA